MKFTLRDNRRYEHLLTLCLDSKNNFNLAAVHSF